MYILLYILRVVKPELMHRSGVPSEVGASRTKFETGLEWDPESEGYHEALMFLAWLRRAIILSHNQ